MVVTALRRKRGKGQPPERLLEWRLQPGNARDVRQISLLCLEAREAMERMEIRGLWGLCMKRFFANLEIAGLPPLESGDRLAVGDVLLKITSARKDCFAECPLARAGEACLLKTECRFGRVIRGGLVALGDQVSLLPDVDG